MSGGASHPLDALGYALERGCWQIYWPLQMKKSLVFGGVTPTRISGTLPLAKI